MADARARRADAVATVLVWSVALLVTAVFVWPTSSGTALAGCPGTS